MLSTPLNRAWTGCRRWSPFVGVALLAVACGGGSSPTAPGLPPPVDLSALVGVMGCSQSTAAWDGWEALGGTGSGGSRVWTKQVGYGGGTIAKWARDIPGGDYWRRLDSNIASNQIANVVWWEICDLATRNGSIADAEAVVAEIQNRIPGATVYVSPLADFERPETCVKQDIANSNLLVDHLVASRLAERGPDLPRVLDIWIQPPQGDGGCHVGPDGQEQFGRSLAGFDWNAGVGASQSSSVVDGSSAPEMNGVLDGPRDEPVQTQRPEGPFERP